MTHNQKYITMTTCLVSKLITMLIFLIAFTYSQQPTNSLKITSQKPGLTKEVEITPEGNIITTLQVEAIPDQLEGGELKIEKIDAGAPEAKVVVSKDKFMVPDRCISETNISDPLPGDIELNNVKNQLFVPQVIFPGEEAGSKCLAIAGSVEERENPVAAVMYMDNLVYELEDDVYQLAYANLGSEGKSVYENDNTFFQYHLKDHLGSTRMVLAEDLSLKESMAYHPYGQEVPIDVDNSGEKLRDKFTGKELDEEGTAGVIHLDITITGFTSTTGSEGELVITYIDGGEQEVIELQNLDLSGTVVQYQQIVSLLSEKVIDQLELNVTGSEPDIISYIFDFDNSDEDYSEVIEMGDKVTLGLTETVQDINSGASGGFMIYNQDDAYVGLDLNYFGARFYDAEIGFFATVDPEAANRSWITPYAYAINNPIRFEDFQGLGPKDRIQAARNFIGTPYEQETGKLRIGYSDDALKNMDCSELVSRVIDADLIRVGVPNMNAKALREYFDEDPGMVHSTDNPKVGDIAMWGRHTGIVSEVGENNTFKLIHAAGKDKFVNENQWLTTADKYNSTTFYGFYRPANETHEGKVKPIK